MPRLRPLKMVDSVEMGLCSFGDVTADIGRMLPQAQVIRNLVREGVLADQMGIDFFGIGEHHRADYAVSAPEVVLATIAAKTSRIKLGSAATILATDDPVRVFQRFSTLNALAEGRVEVILGRGWFTESFRIFGYEVADYESLFNAKLQLFTSLVRQKSVTWKGKFRSQLTSERIYPPVAGPPLPIWLAVGSTPESVLRAANYDLPMMLAIIGGDPQRFIPFATLYRRAFEKLGRSAKEIGIHSPGYIADTDAIARDEFWSAYQPMRDALGAERGWPPITRRKFDAEVDRGSLYVGSAEFVSERIVETMHSIGASRFDLKYSVGRLPHENLLRSIELYGREVIPRVKMACPTELKI